MAKSKSVEELDPSERRAQAIEKLQRYTAAMLFYGQALWIYIDAVQRHDIVTRKQVECEYASRDDPDDIVILETIATLFSKIDRRAQASGMCINKLDEATWSDGRL